MQQFKVDTSTAVVMVATEPVSKVANRQTGEIAIDNETGAKLMTARLHAIGMPPVRLGLEAVALGVRLTAHSPAKLVGLGAVLPFTDAPDLYV